MINLPLFLHIHLLPLQISVRMEHSAASLLPNLYFPRSSTVGTRLSLITLPFQSGPDFLSLPYLRAPTLYHCLTFSSSVFPDGARKPERISGTNQAGSPRRGNDQRRRLANIANRWWRLAVIGSNWWTLSDVGIHWWTLGENGIHWWTLSDLAMHWRILADT